MNSNDTKIFIFTLPQSLIIDEAQQKLVCNVVVMPRFTPLEPLAEGVNVGGNIKDFVPFAESDIQLTAYLVKGNELLPNLDAHDDDSYAVPANDLPGNNSSRTNTFEKIKTFFDIDEAFGRDIELAPIRKYLPKAYRNAFGFAGARQGAVTDDSYFCALRENAFTTPLDERDKDTVNWSQVMAFCLHQPKLAVQLGLLYEGVEMDLPEAGYYKEGGWVYADLKEQAGNLNSYHDLPPENLQRYAAWIPASTKSRSLFSPVLFPVEQPAATETFDDIFDEVLRYNDGFAKIVHASQPVSTDHLAEESNGTAPVTDTGIRLAWDDEQVLEWYNRGFQSLSKIDVGVKDTPLVVSRYRVDVATMDPADIHEQPDTLEDKLDWKSQVAVSAEDLQADDIDLGSFDVELGVEVSPAKHGDKGDYWLPAYFANWNGTCLCVPDPLPEKLNQLGDVRSALAGQVGGPPEAPKMMYRQRDGDKIHLKYGDTYAFRVRLSDISGGGPGPGDRSTIKGEQKLAIQPFKRFVAPQPVSLTAANDGLSLILQRPRLNYPAILFTRVDTENAIAELLLDRIRLNELRSRNDDAPNKQWVREVGLPDPDVTQVEIVVEIKSLEMDREDSYHALNHITPKESFVFLYKTFRKFPAYVLNHDPEGDEINLALTYQDVPSIHFKAADRQLGLAGNIHSDDGPLILPTARDIRLTIRSFCPDETPGYFGSEASRSSIGVVKTLRQDPLKLEEAPLFSLSEPADNLISIFFRPEPIITPQFMDEQRIRGKGSQKDSDLLDRLAEITGLVHKNGSILGNDNIRTQFGCTATINHSVSPDRSSITFASRDDFYHKWINVIQLDLNRDWTWDLLKPDSFKVFRQWRLDGEADFLPREEVGGVFLTKGLNWQAMNEPNRSFTRLVFIDALDPKPQAGKFPEPLEVRYFIEPRFRQVKDGEELKELEWDHDLTIKKLENEVPITTPPAQVPAIIAVGIALSPDNTEEELIANRYSETATRNRYLWIQFDKPLEDKKDLFFGRVLAYAADPMLAAQDDLLNATTLVNGKMSNPGNPGWKEAWNDHLVREQPEPPINLDPEVIRVIRPRQVFDQSGLEAMQPLTPASTPDGTKPVHFLLPLPPGIYPDSEELFGFFTYEFRVGHHDPKKWCTAQGRYGSPLRLTGVQHPAPPMLVNTMRDRDKVLVSTRHAQSFFNGKNCTPAVPRTEIYALLYAQVLQADGVEYRNILLDKLLLLKPTFTTDVEKIKTYEKRKAEKEDLRNPFSAPDPPVLLPGTPPYAVGFWNGKNIREKLRFLGISENAPLSVLTVELMPRNIFHNADLSSKDPFLVVPPLDPQPLVPDEIRILRTSPLCPVMETCAVAE